jgi:hypothetical protein
VKPLDDFHRSSRQADGRHYYCKPCQNRRVAESNRRHAARVAESKRAYRERRRAELGERYRAYYQANRPRFLERRARERAAGFGVAVEELDYVAIYERDGGACYLCGRDVALEVASWDHVVPCSAGGPHIAENVRVTHLACNFAKNARTTEEIALG